MLGDGQTVFAYPFNFNFSSSRSILYIADALTFSPLELCLALTAVSWFVAGTALAPGTWAADRCCGRCWPSEASSWSAWRTGSAAAATSRWRCGRSGRSCTWSLMLRAGVEPAHPHRAIRASGLGVGAGDLGPESVLAPVLLRAPGAASALTSWRASPSTRRRCSTTSCSCWPWRCASSRVARVGRAILLLLAAIPSIYVFVLSQRRAAFIALVVGFMVLALVLASAGARRSSCSRPCC